MEVNKVLRLFLTTIQIIIIASEYQPTLGRRVSRYQWGRQLLKVKRVNQPAWKVRQTVAEQQGKVKRANHIAWKVRQAVAKQQGKVKRVNSLTWKVRQSVPIK
jgi:hypothetical protein